MQRKSEKKTKKNENEFAKLRPAERKYLEKRQIEKNRRKFQ